MFRTGDVPSIRKKKFESRLYVPSVCQIQSKPKFFFVESFGNKTKPPSSESQCAAVFNSGIRILEFGLIISQFDNPASEFPAWGPITYMGNDNAHVV